MDFWWRFGGHSVVGPWYPRMSRAPRGPTMFTMNQSTYEKPRPDGFTGAGIVGYRTLRLGPDDQLGGTVERHERVRVGALHVSDAPAVRAMLGRCSRATLYKRFHGFTDGVAQASHALADANQDVYGAWSADGCVGMASLAITEEGHGAIGVLVEDRWQRRGAGSALVAALVERAHEVRLTSFIVDILADNYFIIPLLARIGGVTTTFGYSGYRVRVGLESPLTASASRADFPVQGDRQ
jgi:GNAT superfamily N-acetyltransferase